MAWYNDWSDFGDGLSSVFGGGSSQSSMPFLRDDMPGNEVDLGGMGDTNSFAPLNDSYNSSNGLSSIFGQGGMINQYAPAIKAAGGVMDYFRGQKQQNQLQGLSDAQMRFVTGQQANSNYWDQSARNAQMGLDPMTMNAMRTADQAASRKANLRGINPIHARLAAQNAMADAQRSSVDSYGKLGTGYAGNVSQGNSVGSTMQGNAFAAGNKGVASLFGSMAQNIPEYEIINGRIVEKKRA